jgi:transposase
VAACAQRLKPVEAAIKGAVTKADVAHFDETGMRVVKQLHWIHTASTPELTYYNHHPKRGRDAFTDSGIFKEFTGTAVHDCLISYLNPDYGCNHALCCAHLLREMLGLWEDTRQTWTQRMSALLRSLKRAKEPAQIAGHANLDIELLQRYRRAYGRVVARALLKNPAPKQTGKRGHPINGRTRSLLLRFEQHEDAVLRFAIDFAVPFDNNLAERDLRMVKLHQKISGCFRSEEGAKHFCTIRGYISTLRKQSLDIMAALVSVFAGNTIQPSLKPA